MAIALLVPFPIFHISHTKSLGIDASISYPVRFTLNYYYNYSTVTWSDRRAVMRDNTHFILLAALPIHTDITGIMYAMYFKRSTHD